MFAVPALEALSKSQHTIAAVVTGPDKPSGRGKKLQPTPVKLKAQELGLRVLTPSSLQSDELFNQIFGLEPDLIIVIAFRILPERLFQLPDEGAVNIHASLLPKYRGAAPIQWALINGEKETGLTSFFLKKKVDTGDVILQQKVKIEDDDNFDSLSLKLSKFSGQFLLETVNMIDSGNITLQKQDHRRATPAPKLTPENCMIDFGFPAVNVHNFIRGLSTTPSAYTFYKNKKIKIYKSRLCDEKPNEDLEPGSIIQDKSRLLVQCSNSVIELLEVVPEGRKPMDGRSFINGFQPQKGEMFGTQLKVFRG